MQFIPLINFTKLCRLYACYSNNANPFVDVNGATGQYLDTTSTDNFRFLLSANSPATSTHWYGFFIPYASSAESLPASTTSKVSLVGSTSAQSTKTDKGWIMNFTITASEDATIRHLIFCKQYKTTSSYTVFAVFAIKLDNPVQLNEANNHTADFVLKVEFN